jgi:hypothetical protein
MNDIFLKVVYNPFGGAAAREISSYPAKIVYENEVVSLIEIEIDKDYELLSVTSGAGRAPTCMVTNGISEDIVEITLPHYNSYQTLFGFDNNRGTVRLTILKQ